MEIDFLGLSSPKYNMDLESSMNVYTDTATGGVETSLSLSTSSSIDSHKEILNFSEKKKAWEFPACDKMIPSCSGSTLCGLAPYSQENSARAEHPGLLLVATPAFRHSSAAGFLYDLNDAAASTKLRSMSEIPAEPPTSLTMLYSGCPNVFNEADKAENTMYVAGNSSTGLSGSGYTPTVAMARRASLARFLEKRLHRMNRGRAPHLMGKPMNATNSEAGETNITRSNKKRNNNLKRRS